ASARAAAWMSKSIGIPPHLSLPPFDVAILTYRIRTNQRASTAIPAGAARHPTEDTMQATHPTGTRQAWLAARLELLEAEKELTRRSDELARRRQELPWVRIDKPYQFDTDAEIGRAHV